MGGSIDNTLTKSMNAKTLLEEKKTLLYVFKENGSLQRKHSYCVCRRLTLTKSYAHEALGNRIALVCYLCVSLHMIW